MKILNGIREIIIGKPEFMFTEEDIPENPDMDMIHGGVRNQKTYKTGELRRTAETQRKRM